MDAPECVSLAIRQSKGLLEELLCSLLWILSSISSWEFVTGAAAALVQVGCGLKKRKLYPALKSTPMPHNSTTRTLIRPFFTSFEAMSHSRWMLLLLLLLWEPLHKMEGTPNQWTPFASVLASIEGLARISLHLSIFAHSRYFNSFTLFQRNTFDILNWMILYTWRDREQNLYIKYDEIFWRGCRRV